MTGLTHTRRVVSRHLAINALHELQYRANFFVQLFQSASQVGGAIVALTLIYGRVDELNGWTEPQLLAVVGVYTLLGGVTRTFVQPAMVKLLTDIAAGTFDFVLTKPADSQLLVSVRSVSIWQALDIVIGAVMVTIAVVRLDGTVGIAEASVFVGLLAAGIATIYSVWLVIATGAFRFVKMDFIDAVYVGTFRAAQYPIGIYPAWLRIGLSTVLPLGLAVTAPAEALTSRLEVGTGLGAVGVSAAALTLSRALWRRGLRQYSGASA